MRGRHGSGALWLCAASAAAIAVALFWLQKEPDPIAAIESAANAVDAPTTPPLGRDELPSEVERAPVPVATADAASEQPAPLVVTGRILDQGSQPVEGAAVRLWAADLKLASTADSDRDGRFSLRLRAPGAFDLSAAKSDTGFAWLANVEVQASREVGDVVLRARVPLLGRLVYPDRQPVAHLGVHLAAVADGAAPGDHGAAETSAKTDAQGRFRAFDLAPGAYRPRLRTTWMRGFEFGELAALSPGGPETEIVVEWHRLRVDSRDLAVYGWREERGGEVEQATKPGGDWLGLLDRWDSSSAGSFGERFVPRGSWWCFETDERESWAQVLVHAERDRNETVVAFESEPVRLSATLRVRFATSGHAPPTALEVVRCKALAFGHLARIGPVGRDGSDFVFRTTAGRHRLKLQPDPDRFRRSPFFPVERDVEMFEGAETVLVVEPVRGGRAEVTAHLPPEAAGGRFRVKVTVPGETGAPPVSLGPYQIQTEDGWESGGAAPPGTPFLCLRLLPPGRHTLTVVAEGCEPEEIGVQIRTGEITPVEVWLER